MVPRWMKYPCSIWDWLWLHLTWHYLSLWWRQNSGNVPGVGGPEKVGERNLAILLWSSLLWWSWGLTPILKWWWRCSGCMNRRKRRKSRRGRVVDEVHTFQERGPSMWGSLMPSCECRRRRWINPFIGSGIYWDFFQCPVELALWMNWCVWGYLLIFYIFMPVESLKKV